MTGFLILENGEGFEGKWLGGVPKAGEVVFNTSHSGYEEIATDPSYFSQIVIMTAPMQGNYGSFLNQSESSSIHLQGFIALDIQKSAREQRWLRRLIDNGTPVLTDLDTRHIVLKIREQGTPWGALVQADTMEKAKEKAFQIIRLQKGLGEDWGHLVSRKVVEDRRGELIKGPRVAVIDFGVKENILREVMRFSSEVRVFPVRTSAREIQEWEPQGILLSNGPGDPGLIQKAVPTVRELLGWRPIFGICMGHQILSLALGGKTYKLRFGHRGSNHPVKDEILNEIYMTSQNHGYAVAPDSLPSEVVKSHWNLYDKTLEGIEMKSRKCMSVQFHPESHPGPRDPVRLFDYFRESLT